ncbi:hypothetical protein [Microbacterium amylolyticum]|uniref:Uncharacterized protein n=1 Tax=Microbacterium amylolyticum TaxID=936337 RepID=A0ABS4ZIA4_9MICO|nr:hypothetical protein [Microbacterium amylolyticum]MBP2437005.1 hypothetical protein [Microbacterium amylolyticum]
MPVGSVAQPAVSPAPSRPVLRLVLAILLLLALIAAIVASFFVLHKNFWSASAFAERYVHKIADGDASGALAMPGVDPDFTQLEAAGYPNASAALLRSATLTSDIEDIRAVAERRTGDDAVEVDVEYTIDGVPGAMTFSVTRTGWAGLVPDWAFTTSPMTVIDVTVRGSWRYTINGFEMDKRQVSFAGYDADPLEPIPMLAFAPGAYEVSVDTAATAASPETVRAQAALDVVDIDVQALPTAELSQLVQDGVQRHFDEVCTVQRRLKPEDCPFEYDGSWGIAQPDIEWTVARYPQTALVPDGDGWRISPTTGVMHLTLTMQRYFDGVMEQVDEDVHFAMDGTVEIHEGGSVEIVINKADLDLP